MAVKKVLLAPTPPIEGWEIHPLAVEPSPLDMKPRSGQAAIHVHPERAGSPTFTAMLEEIAKKATREAARAHIKAGRLVRTPTSKP